MPGQKKLRRHCRYELENYHRKTGQLFAEAKIFEFESCMFIIQGLVNQLHFLASKNAELAGRYYSAQ